jgi:hypothetical protein
MRIPTVLRRRPSYASVAATLALVFSLGGTAFAVASVVAPNSVDTAAIQNHAVTSPKLAAEAVSNNKIEPGAVTGDKIAPGTVTGDKIAPGAVTGDRIAPLAVANNNIGPGAVTSAKLGTGAVTNSRLAGGAVDASKLAGGAVTHAKLAANSVTGGDVENNTLHVADFVGIDESGLINFTILAHSCGTLTFTVSGAQLGQAAFLTWESAYPRSITIGPLKVASSTKITASACNLTGHDITGQNIKIRVITLS